MAYYHVANTGKGFITHEDNESSHITGYPGDIWITENSSWASRVGAILKTKEEAQALVNVAIEGNVNPEIHENAGAQVVLLLP